MLEMGGLSKTWHLVQLLKVVPHVWVVHDPFQVALEESHIDTIEANKGGVEINVSYGHFWSSQISILDQYFFHSVQTVK